MLKHIVLFVFFKIKYKKKLILGKNVIISKNSKFNGINRLHDNVIFNGSLAGCSYIGKNSIIYGQVGKYCSIGEFVKVLIGRHPIDHLSTSPVFYSLEKQAGITYTKIQRYDEYIYADFINKYGVIIGNDVWIGSSAVIIGGIVIGDGAVVLANAVVTKDVPPYAIVGGVPAEVVKYRFSQTQIEFLIDFKWWNKDESWINENLDTFNNIGDFILKNSK